MVEGNHLVKPSDAFIKLEPITSNTIANERKKYFIINYFIKVSFKYVFKSVGLRPNNCSRSDAVTSYSLFFIIHAKRDENKISPLVTPYSLSCLSNSCGSGL